MYFMDGFTVCFSEIDKKQGSSDAEHESLKETLKLLAKKKDDLSEEKFELETEVEKGKSLVDQKNTEVNMILKEIEASKNEQATLEGDRYSVICMLVCWMVCVKINLKKTMSYCCFLSRRKITFCIFLQTTGFCNYA